MIWGSCRDPYQMTTRLSMSARQDPTDLIASAKAAGYRQLQLAEGYAVRTIFSSADYVGATRLHRERPPPPTEVSGSEFHLASSDGLPSRLRVVAPY